LVSILSSSKAPTRTYGFWWPIKTSSHHSIVPEDIKKRTRTFIHNLPGNKRRRERRRGREVLRGRKGKGKKEEKEERGGSCPVSLC
jgi:hypothetical protein